MEEEMDRKQVMECLSREQIADNEDEEIRNCNLPDALLGELNEMAYFRHRVKSYKECFILINELVRALDDNWLEIMEKIDPDCELHMHMEGYWEYSEQHILAQKLKQTISENIRKQIAKEGDIPF